MVDAKTKRNIAFVLIGAGALSLLGVQFVAFLSFTKLVSILILALGIMLLK